MSLPPRIHGRGRPFGIYNGDKNENDNNEPNVTNNSNSNSGSNTNIGATSSSSETETMGRERLQKYFDFPIDSWQAQAGGEILEGRNVIVCAPTGAGKTVVS